MSFTTNIKGTSFPSFTIGKKGTTLYQGSSEPVGIDGDFWLDGNSGELKTKISGVWELIRFDNISISGNTISALDTNGDVILAPDGSGTVRVATVGYEAFVTDDNDLITKKYFEDALGPTVIFEGPLLSTRTTIDLTQSGPFNLGTLPANTIVLETSIEVITASDNPNTTLEIGDSANGADSYMSALQNDPSTEGVYVVESSVQNGGVDRTMQATLTNTSTGAASAEIVVQYRGIQIAAGAGNGGGGGGDGPGFTWTVTSSNETLTANAAVLVDASGGLKEQTIPTSIPAATWFIVHAFGGQVRIVSNGNIISAIGAGNDLLLEAGETAYLVSRATGILELV